MTGTPPPVGPRDIADLLARALSLTRAAGGTADPAAHAAYLAAKADLLIRIVDQLAADHPDHARATRVTDHARRTARRAAARLATDHRTHRDKP